MIISIDFGEVNDYNHRVPGRPSQHDPEFLTAVSVGFSKFLDEHPDFTQERMAKELGVNQATISKYISKATSIEGEILARACTCLNMTFTYKGFILSAGALATEAVDLNPVSSPVQQLSFTFDAMYGDKTSQWKVSHTKLEPLEFHLRIKVA